MAMTKIDVARRIQEQIGLPHTLSGEVTEVILDTMKEVLVRGESVLISGFGRFESMEKRPRVGRNPQTGEVIVLKERRVLTFKPSAVLRERLNGKE